MRMWLAVALVLVAGGSVSSQEMASLGLEYKIVGQDRCQFTPDIQGVTLHVELKFVNTSKNNVVIQQIKGLTLTAAAKSLSDLQSGVYELRWQPEHFEPERPKNSKPIVLKPKNSFVTTDTVVINLVRHSSVAAPDVQLRAGRHYLQIGEVLILGDADPRTWHSISVLSAPAALTLDYSDEAMPACPQTGQEQ